MLLTSDASDRTVSHMKDACEDIVACEQMPLTSADLAMLTPKPAAVFGVTDEHLAQLCANTFDRGGPHYMDFKYKIADVAKEFGVPAKRSSRP